MAKYDNYSIEVVLKTPNIEVRPKAAIRLEEGDDVTTEIQKASNELRGEAVRLAGQLNIPLP